MNTISNMTRAPEEFLIPEHQLIQNLIDAYDPKRYSDILGRDHKHKCKNIFEWVTYLEMGFIGYQNRNSSLRYFINARKDSMYYGRLEYLSKEYYFQMDDVSEPSGPIGEYSDLVERALEGRINIDGRLFVRRPENWAPPRGLNGRLQRKVILMAPRFRNLVPILKTVTPEVDLKKVYSDIKNLRSRQCQKMIPEKLSEII